MRFAIVGECVEAVFLAEAIHTSTEHQILTACVSDTLALAMTERGIGYSLVSSSEEAILHPKCDAVLIAVADVDRSMAMVRQASQAGCHVVVIPPQNVSTAFSFELHLLLDESEKGIVPLTGRWYVKLPEPPVEAESGVQQLSMSFPLVPDELSQYQLRGVDALCACGFTFSQVTGLDMPGADGRLLSRSITLAASAASERNVPPATLSFTSEAVSDEVAIIVKESGGQNHRCRTALPSPEMGRDHEFQRQVLERVTERLADAEACQRGMEQFSNTLEMIEGLEKSLRRRRTVDVYLDGVSERSAFKTQMTAIGCGVLTWLMLGLVAYLIVAKVADLPPTVLQIGRIIWIAPIVLFLLAQLLLPLARERSGKTDNRSSGDKSG